MGNVVVYEVKGLDQARENMKGLLRDMRTRISRDALREAGWRLARPMRAATYTTFQRLSGKIQSGLSVIVQKEFEQEQLKAHVIEYPQSITGTDPVQALFRAHMRLKGHRPSPRSASPDRGLRVDLTGVAYWWRFLEFGTGPRRGSSTPRFLRSGKISSSVKRQNIQRASAKKWLASPSRGGIQSRSWLRPIASSQSQDAIAGFRTTLLDEIERTVNGYPK